MNNLIEKIMTHKEIRMIFNEVLDNLYKRGPISGTDMEILSYLNVYEKEEFEKYSDRILKYMGIHFKSIPNGDLHDVIFSMYKK